MLKVFWWDKTPSGGDELCYCTVDDTTTHRQTHELWFKVRSLLEDGYVEISLKTAEILYL